MDIRFLNLEYLFLLIYNLLTGQHETSIPGHLLEYWETYKIIATFLTLFLATGIIYCVVRIFQIRKEERAELGIIFKPVTSEEKQNTDWERILEHSKSDNPNDWKQAIIDADVLLEKMVDVMGYRGENLGEKLKQIEQNLMQLQKTHKQEHLKLMQEQMHKHQKESKQENNIQLSQNGHLSKENF